jgi:bifunctional oligoribonuclease and PAP phosphatase NrnA
MNFTDVLQIFKILGRFEEKYKLVHNNFQDSFIKIKQTISDSDQFCIITHTNPDGDAIGSSLGLFHILNNLGKKVTVIVPNDYPEFLQWLPGNEDVLHFNRQKSQCCKSFAETKVIFCLDFNELSRSNDINQEIKKSTAFKILIDHHPYPEDVFDLQISDISVSSTAELVLETIIETGLESYLDKNSATCLFTGLMTDTISFNVNCSTPRTFEIAAKLLSYGINKEEVHQKVFDNYSVNRQKLLGYMLLNKMIILPEYSTGYIWLSKQELKEFEFQQGDSEGFVNYPLSIKGVNFAAFFMEREDHIKISFRSRGNIPVNTMMSENFSGGGHKNAAGGDEYKLNLEDTLQKFLSLLPKYATILKGE